MLGQEARGRPATGAGIFVGVRLQPKALVTLNKRAAEQSDDPSRSEAIRRLVEFGLKHIGDYGWYPLWLTASSPFVLGVTTCPLPRTVESERC